MSDLPFLRQPPFPELRFFERFWEGEDVLPSWRGYPTRFRPDDPRSALFPWTVGVLVLPPRKESPPAAEQIAAYAHLKADERTVAETLRRALVAHIERRGVPTPPGDLWDRFMMNPLVVLPVARDGLAYVGYEVGCDWENTGRGIVLHGTRLVDDVRDVSTEFDGVFQDGGRLLQ